MLLEKENSSHFTGLRQVRREICKDTGKLFSHTTDLQHSYF